MGPTNSNSLFHGRLANHMAHSYSYLRRKGKTALAVMPYSAEIVDWAHYSSPYSRFWDQPLVLLDRFMCFFLCDPPVLLAPPNRRCREVVFCPSVFCSASRDTLNPNTTANRELPSTPFLTSGASPIGSFFWRSDVVVSHCRPAILRSTRGVFTAIS